MTVLVEKEDDKEGDEHHYTIRQKCAKCLKGANLIKTVVILCCSGIVVQQITVCISKLVNVPITTYTHFDFNKTLLYPSLTFCREPPYKFDKMLEYNLYAHPRFTSPWMAFNFSAVTLDQLWDDITYNHTEFFVQYGLNGWPDNVAIHSQTFFMHGRCHTLVPKIQIGQATRNSGYSIALQHSAQDVATSTSVYAPGYHVFVHYVREPYTEITVYNGGQVDYLYVNTGDTIDVKLTVDAYTKISSEDDPCTYQKDYSANTCTSQHVYDIVGEAAGCSGPWITSSLPRCNNYTSMRNLITAYMNTYDCHNKVVCPRFCQAYLYNAFVTERQKQYLWDSSFNRWAVRTGDAELQSQLYIHFNSMMVSVFEESYNYDWNIFIADLGGSVGFLLGLSVIGLMTIVGKMWYKMINSILKTKKMNTASSITSSTVTARVEELYKEQNNKEDKKERKNEELNLKSEDLFKKCNDWQLKNLKELNL